MIASLLRPLGIYGYDQVEPIILAALITEDPLLLIGRHGTGKTFLLNSLSEALGLVHRHYNASIISFDDLVGFPYPEANGASIRYLQTPATVWPAESVLIDEINRCRPEQQNRLFSLVQERRLQGIKLEKLRYRWAAMNPTGTDDGYIGTEALDPALADRFAFVVNVADWEDLTPADRLRIADPRGDGALSRDDGALIKKLEAARARFAALLAEPPAHVLAYACEVTTLLGEAKLRLSPRRSRQLTRNLLAVIAVSDLPLNQLFKLVLKNSIPQFATGEQVSSEAISAAHRIAWDAVTLNGHEQWLHEFAREPDLARKATLLLKEAPGPDTASAAIAQFLAGEPPERSFAFVLAVAPHLLALPADKCPVGAEGLADLSRAVAPLLHQDKTVIHRKGNGTDNSVPWCVPGGGYWLRPVNGYEELEKFIQSLPRTRRERAGVYLDALVQKSGKVPEKPSELIASFQSIIAAVKETA